MPCLLLLLAGIVFGASSHFIVERCRKDYKNIRQLRSSSVIPEGELIGRQRLSNYKIEISKNFNFLENAKSSL